MKNEKDFSIIKMKIFSMVLIWQC